MEQILENVKTAMLTMQRFPWEQGVASQALLELGDLLTAELLARDAVLRQSDDGRLGTAFYRDDIAIFGDDITVTDSSTNGEVVQFIGLKKNNEKFLHAADKQLRWLTEDAPKTDCGILCHVKSSKQVWVDSIFMALPFMVLMGYYREAEEQLDGFYRLLLDNKTGLLSHIWDEDIDDFACKDFWGVGNGWAAAGMAKIIRYLPESEINFKQKTIGRLTSLIDSCLRYKSSENLFHNIIDDAGTFIEVNLAQMLCYSIFSGASEGWLSSSYAETAKDIRIEILKNVDEAGLVHKVCGSPTFAQPGTAVEGQAFFLLMEAAWKKYKN
jgi:rhamnogalacturonyl hydrolase YesR